jgi:hypothetical protein
MQLIIIDADGDQAAVLSELADEMTEDPRCSFVMRGLESDTARTSVLVSGWEDLVATEVHAGLVMSGWAATRFDSVD